jgi:hypothetical protein
MTDQPAGTGTAGGTPAPSPARKAADTPAPAAAGSKAPVAAPDPEPPAPDVMAVAMANATHGARWPGDVVTVDAETGRALVRSGEAFPA